MVRKGLVLWIVLLGLGSSAATILEGCLPEGGVDPVQRGRDNAQLEAFDLQEQLPCDVEPMDKDLFYEEIKTLLGVG